MCWLLFTPNIKRYHFFTPCYCSPYAMLKEVGMTKDAPVETIPDTDPEEAADAAIMKVLKEK
jgi:hypothetical protein